MKYFWVLAAFWLIAAVHAAPKGAYAKTTDGKNVEWMQKGRTAVKSRLKQPNSALFRNVTFHRSSNGIPMICGEVNCKDDAGNYVGFQKFISTGGVSLTLLERQETVMDLPTIWEKFCQ